MIDVKKGDTVWVQGFGRDLRKATVTAVGPVWVRIDRGRGRYQRSNGTLENYSQCYIQTEEQYALTEQRRVLLAELRDLKFDQVSRLPVDKLEALVLAVRPILATRPSSEEKL